MSMRTPPSGGTLLVGSTGGHLEELFRLRRRLAPSDGAVEWVTFDDPQSRSLLAGERVHYVPYVPPRGYLPVAKTFPAAHRILRRGGFAHVVSTGSGIALPFFAAARTLDISCHYIESAARTEGPSLTGRLISHIPGARLYTQHRSWSSGRWSYQGSLFDQFERRNEDAGGSPGVRRVVVTLGSMRTYPFRRAVERLAVLLPQVVEADAEILWQVGPTRTADLGVDGRDQIPTHELTHAIAQADLVIAHAGIGSALTALEAGKCPVLLPRRHLHGEHVDDHQLLIAADLNQRRLALSRDVDELTTEDLQKAAGSAVVSSTSGQMFHLVDTTVVSSRFSEEASAGGWKVSQSVRLGSFGPALGGAKGEIV